MNKQESLAKLQKQLEQIPQLKNLHFLSPEFAKWKRHTETTVQYVFGENTRHVKEFNKIHYAVMALGNISDYQERSAFHAGLDRASAILESMIDEVRDLVPEDCTPQKQDHLLVLERLCLRFHVVAKQLRVRHQNRRTLIINDEYDVQDLFHALLRLEFEDVRREEWTPSYAGGSARVDFLLKAERTVVEVKKTRKGLGAKDLGEQLLIDIQKYKQHPDCKALVCFAYDPDGLIANPRGLENDLSRETDGLAVRVIIAPRV